MRKLVARIFFRKITILQPERIPASGAVCFVGLHRNGAADGFPINEAVPDATFMIAEALRRKAHLRMFYDGIGVMRQQDAGSVEEKRAYNLAAMDQCHQVLADGGKLYIFPEGTSTLGPKHLPFRSGASRIIQRAVDAGVPVQVIPVAIRYEAGTRFQRDVELLFGDAIPVQAEENCHALNRRICKTLDELACEYEDEAEQQRHERLAYAATIGSKQSYLRNLMRLQSCPPARVTAIDQAICAATQEHRLATHQGVPVFPIGASLPYLLLWLLLAPMVALAAVTNALPLAVGYLAGKKGADGANAVTAWRIAFGVPAGMAWIGIVFVVALAFGQLPLFAAWLVCSWIGLRSSYREKKLRTQLFNAFFRRKAIKPLRALHHLLNQELTDDGFTSRISSAA